MKYFKKFSQKDGILLNLIFILGFILFLVLWQLYAFIQPFSVNIKDCGDEIVSFLPDKSTSKTFNHAASSCFLSAFETCTKARIHFSESTGYTARGSEAEIMGKMNNKCTIHVNGSYWTDTGQTIKSQNVCYKVTEITDPIDKRQQLSFNNCHKQ